MPAIASSASMAQPGDRARGVVKWFNPTKGFGFITPDDGGEDLFVHQSSIKADGFRSLAEGEEIEFSVSEDDGGRVKAVDVTGPDGSNVRGASLDGGGRGRGASGGSCYNCGGTGHLARDCHQGGGRSGGGGGGGGGGGSCYNCGETGHLSRDCQQGRSRGGGGGGGGACYNCGETGHLARDCHQGGGGGGGGGRGRYNRAEGGGERSCYNCGGTGHFARECSARN